MEVANAATAADDGQGASLAKHIRDQRQADEDD
jgi:hypothetical protein